MDKQESAADGATVQEGFSRKKQWARGGFQRNHWQNFDETLQLLAFEEYSTNREPS